MSYQKHKNSDNNSNNGNNLALILAAFIGGIFTVIAALVGGDVINIGNSENTIRTQVALEQTQTAIVQPSTETPFPTNTATAIPTLTFTPTPTNTAASTPLPTNTATSTPLPTNTTTYTPLPTNTRTSTPTPLPSATPIPPTPLPSLTPVPPTPVPTATIAPIIDLGNISVPGNNNQGTSYRIPEDGIYYFEYVGGSYSTYRTNHPDYADDARWLPEVIVYDNPNNFWDGIAVNRRNQLFTLSNIGGYAWTPQEAENRALSSYSRRETQRFNAGDQIYFLPIDERPYYYDNPGSVIINIKYQPL